MDPALLKVIGGIGIALLVLLMFRAQIGRLLDRTQDLKIKLSSGQEISLTAKEARDAASALLEEADRLIRLLQQEDKRLLAKIVAAGRAVKVDEIVPGFKRESSAHESLRRLRDCQLIRPVGGGRFDAGKFIEVKAFGAVLIRLRSKELGIE